MKQKRTLRRYKTSKRTSKSSRGSDIDWVAIDAMSDRDIARQVRSNPDAAPILGKGELMRKLRSGKARVVVPTPDVTEIRKSLGMSQAKFAAAFMLQVSTVRNWEQGRNVPDGPAALYLQLIRNKPREIRKALAEIVAASV
jgi:putative transcriptional regulator